MPYTVSLRDDNYTDWARSIETSWRVAINVDSKSVWAAVAERLDGIRVGLIYCTELIHSPESEKTFDLIVDDIRVLVDIAREYQIHAKGR